MRNQTQVWRARSAIRAGAAVPLPTLVKKTLWLLTFCARTTRAGSRRWSPRRVATSTEGHTSTKRPAEKSGAYKVQTLGFKTWSPPRFSFRSISYCFATTYVENT